jgi:hypothetical protein
MNVLYWLRELSITDFSEVVDLVWRSRVYVRILAVKNVGPRVSPVARV